MLVDISSMDQIKDLFEDYQILLIASISDKDLETQSILNEVQNVYKDYLMSCIVTSPRGDSIMKAFQMNAMPQVILTVMNARNDVNVLARFSGTKINADKLIGYIPEYTELFLK